MTTRCTLTVDTWLAQMDRIELLAHCHRVVAGQLRHGIERSARGVYYDLVGAGIVPQDRPDKHGKPTRRVYRRILDTIAKAKLAGQFPLEWLRDDLRAVREGAVLSAFFDADDALDEVVEYLRWLPGHLIRADRWWRQPQVPVVIAEKDTLVGTIRQPCKEAGVPWYVCRGYSSVTGMWALAKYIRSIQTGAHWDPEIVVLYIGDHDPEGLDIPTVVQRRLAQIYDLKGWQGAPDDWRRVALTRAQAVAMGAPAMPVKESSARAAGYIAEHGMDAWEVEAMPSRRLQRELRDAIDDVFDEDVFEDVQDAIPEAQAELRARLLAEGGELAERAFGEDGR